MIYKKQESDGYTKVGAGACQLQCRNPYMSRLGVIHSDVAPAASDKPEFIYKGDGPHTTPQDAATLYADAVSKGLLS